jgi:hypothetical protein
VAEEDARPAFLVRGREATAIAQALQYGLLHGANIDEMAFERHRRGDFVLISPFGTTFGRCGVRWFVAAEPKIEPGRRTPAVVVACRGRLVVPGEFDL